MATTNTLDDLLHPEDEDGVLTWLLTTLASLGFPTVAWQTGSTIYTVLRAESKTIADTLKLVTAIAAGGLLDLSTGGWLTLLAKSAYDLDRLLAQFAVGVVAVSIPGGFPPQTIAPGQLWLQTAAGLRYNSINTAPVVVGAGTTVNFSFRAEQTGLKYNVPVGTGLTFVTPLPGMTAAFVDQGTGTWLTTQGTDGELDADLRTRCRSRWATVGLQKTVPAYVFLSMDVPGVATAATKVFVDDSNPRGPGTVNVWISGPSGPVSTADETLVRNYIVARKSVCTDVQVQNATPTPINVLANVYYTSDFPNAAADAAINIGAALAALPIGGRYNLASCIEQIMIANGVTNTTGVSINSFAADFQLAFNQVAVPGTITLTPIITTV